jgi:hypothetical protein
MTLGPLELLLILTIMIAVVWGVVAVVRRGRDTA